MNNDQKPKFEVRQAEDGTYHVVQVFGTDTAMVIHQTLRSSKDEAEQWLKAIEDVLKLTRSV